MGYVAAARKAAFGALLNESRANLFEQAFAGVQTEAMAVESVLTVALAVAPALAAFPASELGHSCAWWRR